MMEKKALEDALAEASEFVRRATEVLGKNTNDRLYIYGPPKETGALRRQSMELTRALAEMRKR